MTTSNLPTLTFRDAAASGRQMTSDAADFRGVLWRRAGAYFVDATVIVTINVVLHVLLFILGFLTFGLSWLLLGPVTFLTVALAYDTLLIGSDKAATPGMRLFGVEMRGVEGQRPDYFQAFLMSALFYATVPVTGFLILLVALFTDGNRTAHDILSGMTAVRRGR